MNTAFLKGIIFPVRRRALLFTRKERQTPFSAALSDTKNFMGLCGMNMLPVKSEMLYYSEKAVPA